MSKPLHTSQLCDGKCIRNHIPLCMHTFTSANTHADSCSCASTLKHEFRPTRSQQVHFMHSLLPASSRPPPSLFPASSQPLPSLFQAYSLVFGKGATLFITFCARTNPQSRNYIIHCNVTHLHLFIYIYICSCILHFR